MGDATGKLTVGAALGFVSGIMARKTWSAGQSLSFIILICTDPFEGPHLPLLPCFKTDTPPLSLLFLPFCPVRLGPQYHFISSLDSLPLSEVSGPVQEGKLTIMVEDTLPLKDAVQAHKRLESHRTKGKLVLKVGEAGQQRL